jgi:hypothetical protein
VLPTGVVQERCKPRAQARARAVLREAAAAPKAKAGRAERNRSAVGRWQVKLRAVDCHKLVAPAGLLLLLLERVPMAKNTGPS